MHIGDLECAGVPETCELLCESFFDPNSSFDTFLSHLNGDTNEPLMQVKVNLPFHGCPQCAYAMRQLSELYSIFKEI